MIGFFLSVVHLITSFQRLGLLIIVVSYIEIVKHLEFNSWGLFLIKVCFCLVYGLLFSCDLVDEGLWLCRIRIVRSIFNHSLLTKLKIF